MLALILLVLPALPSFPRNLDSQVPNPLPEARVGSGVQADEKAILQAIDKLKAADPAERRTALDALHKIGADAVPLILKTLENEHPGLAERIDALVKRLSSKEWKERDEAMRALVRLGRVAKKRLEEHENDPDPEVSWRVKAALAEIQEKSGSEEQQDQARNALLCTALGEIGDPRGVPILLKMLAVRSEELQLRSVEALARLRSQMTQEQADEAGEEIKTLLGQAKEALVKSRLVKALGGLKCAGCVEPLSKLLRDRSEHNVNLKRNIMIALTEIGDARGVRAVIETLVDEEIYVRQGAATVLAPMAGEGFGYDPRATDEENKPAILKFQKWWEKKYGKDWEE